jgi:hypothetical protein
MCFGETTERGCSEGTAMVLRSVVSSSSGFAFGANFRNTRAAKQLVRPHDLDEGNFGEG